MIIQRLIWLLCLLVLIHPPADASDCAIGYFYFKGHSQLDDPALRNAYVRTAIEWGLYEPRPGNFNFGAGNKQDSAINSLLSAGRKVVPSIRCKSPWAVDPVKGKAATAPRDLDRVKPLRRGESYSASYYAFVRRVAEHYKGKLSIVVIENEMNDLDFWGSPVDDYLRVFATAEKAFADVDPNVKLADGGIQGTVLNWLVVSNYIQQGKVAEAARFYQRFTGRAIDETELRQQSRRMMRKQGSLRAQQLLQSDLFAWDGLINFHYYQLDAGLPDVVAFLKKKASPEKQFMTNELGIKTQFTPTGDEASIQMTKKIVQLLSFGVRPIIWFSPSGDEGHNAGALVDKQGAVREPTTSTFRTIARLIGSAKFIRHDVLQPAVHKFQFDDGTQTVDVIWSDGGNNLLSAQTKGAKFFKYSGEELSAKDVCSTGAPVYVVTAKRK